MSTRAISIRPPASLLKPIDDAVEDGKFEDRSKAIFAAIEAYFCNGGRTP
jgi:Arc/MetJ-type ribon-helix-helix transcriptional regulator